MGWGVPRARVGTPRGSQASPHHPNSNTSTLKCPCGTSSGHLTTLRHSQRSPCHTIVSLCHTQASHVTPRHPKMPPSHVQTSSSHPSSIPKHGQATSRSPCATWHLQTRALAPVPLSLWGPRGTYQGGSLGGCPGAQLRGGSSGVHVAEEPLDLPQRDTHAPVTHLQDRAGGDSPAPAPHP